MISDTLNQVAQGCRSKTLGVFLVISTYGCSPNVAVEIYNNTGTPFVLTGCKKAITIASSQVGVIDSIYGCSETIQVQRADAHWSYRLWIPTHNLGETGQSFYRSDRWGLFSAILTVKLQVNSDRRVFALPEGTDFPVTDSIAQPVGFPWQPIATN